MGVIVGAATAIVARGRRGCMVSEQDREACAGSAKPTPRPMKSLTDIAMLLGRAGVEYDLIGGSWTSTAKTRFNSATHLPVRHDGTERFHRGHGHSGR